MIASYLPLYPSSKFDQALLVYVATILQEDGRP